MTVWGTSGAFRNGLTGQQEWARIDNVIAGLNGGYHHRARRSYEQSIPSSITNNVKFDVDNGLVSMWSIKTAEANNTGWNKMINGGYDANIRSLVKSVPSGHKMYLIYNHEPENDGGSPQTLWRKAFARFAKVVLDVGNSKVIPTFNLMQYTWQNGSGRNPNDYNISRELTAAETAACVGTVDGYGHDTPASRTPSFLYDDPYATIMSWGVRGWGIGECGANNVSGRGTWMLALETWINAHPKAEIVCWWHSQANQAYTFLDTCSNDPTSIQKWADIIGRNNGASIPVTAAPSVALPPSSSTGNPTGTPVLGSGVAPGGLARAYGFPTFGEPAFVNIDEPPTQPVDYEEGALYYSDWSTWQLPYGVYTVAGKILSVWWNVVYEGSVATWKWQCRFLIPTFPVQLGEVVTLYEDSVSAYPDDVYSVSDQQTMSNAVIDDSLYLQVGTYKRVSSAYSFHRIFIRVDCSGAKPSVGTVRSEILVDEAITYHLANVADRLLALPFYSYQGHAAPAMELNINDLSSVWEDANWADGTINAVVGAGEASQVYSLASSDTTTTWVVDWTDRFWSISLDSSGITVGNPTGPYLQDSSVVGVTTPNYSTGQPEQIGRNIIQSDVNLYPNIRGKKAPNSKIFSNYGFLAWEVWFDGSTFQYDTMWMFDFYNADGPSFELGAPGYRYSSGYGYAFSNGPSYAYALEVPGNELAFLPLYGGENSNAIYINVGWDTDPEEHLADFVHAPWHGISSFAPFVMAAQLPNGSGILLQRAGHPDDEYNTHWWDGGSEGMGKILAIPFTLGAPTLDGELTEKRRTFARPPIDYTP